MREVKAVMSFLSGDLEACHVQQNYNVEKGQTHGTRNARITGSDEE